MLTQFGYVATFLSKRLLKGPSEGLLLIVNLY